MMHKIKALSILPFFSLAVGCGSSSSSDDPASGANPGGGSPAYQQPNTLVGTLALATEALEGALPNPNAASASLHPAFRLLAGDFDSFDTGHNPGG